MEQGTQKLWGETWWVSQGLGECVGDSPSLPTEVLALHPLQSV